MSNRKKPTKPTTPQAPRRDAEKRLVADVPVRIYKAVRHRITDRGISMKAYLLELLERDGIA